MAGPIALFHFHDRFELCRSRVKFLKRLNPGLPVFGLYGGDPRGFERARVLESAGLISIHCTSREGSAWSRWKDTDLAVSEWYQRFGCTIPFSRVHVIQWDLLFCSGLSEAYRRVHERAVALTGLISLRRIAHTWDWTANSELAQDGQKLLQWVKDEFHYADEPLACIGPGYSLPRAFLHRYSAMRIASLGHDELRLPLFAQILGFDLVDTGFYDGWTNPDTERHFNADGREADPAAVAIELAKRDGCRVFHPCRERFDEMVVDSIARSLS